MVIEDAAQAHGAELGGKRVGGFGKVAAFSFYPGKNLGALGDGGAVVTNDPELYERMRLLRDHGSRKKYYHDMIGFNYRMDTLTGGVLGIKLKHLDQWTQNRRRTTALYRELLSDTPLDLLQEPADCRHVYHLFVVRSENREKLMEMLAAEEIGVNIHYPIPLHMQEAFAYLGYKQGDFPVAEQSASRILSLPLCADITEDEVKIVADAITKYFAAS
jgi:dTDP-4-amino-4,6-dideoxygalactose transaminase